jgi:hypothetical protein
LDFAFAQGARASQAPEDRVIFPLGVACRDILEEILFAVSEGFGRLALRSSRTMYECMIFARYLSLHPSKTDDYLATFHKQWAMVLKNTPSAEKNLPDIHKAVSAQVPAYAAGKRIDLDWSDTSTLKMAEEAGFPSTFHSLAFNYASAFVHPSAVFIIRHMSPGASDDIIEISTKPQDEEAQFALKISHDLILNAIDLRLKYAPSQVLQQRLAECTSDFSRIWGYPPHF